MRTSFNNKTWRSVSINKYSAMAKKRKPRATFFFFLVFLSLLAFSSFVPVLASLPFLSSHSLYRLHRHHHSSTNKVNATKFEIADDKFWKDGQPFQIIGGDLHYFRVHPEYWEDRLLKAKALGLNTIQTYVPWNLHEPTAGTFVFEGVADLISFLKLCQRLDFLVMLRPGPYICAEWDLGGFPPWLLAKKPDLRLRSSDPSYLQMVDKWWGILLRKVAPLLHDNGGPIIMVQIENEYGSYGDDKAYLHHLVRLARNHLGDNIILYTTDGGSRETLKKGTIQGAAVFSAVDFSTGDDPWPIFELQKEFNAPGKSPPLCAEFYTGWLTHWGEKNARTDADFTALALKRILERNGSAVLYMAHGGTNFGFYNGANTGADEPDYKPDITSYDYDAPIRESGDVNNDKFKALRRVIEQFSAESLPPVPPDNQTLRYGDIHLIKTGNLLDMLHKFHMVESENPLSMESVDQMFGYLLYVTEYAAKDNDDGSALSIPKVHDRAQVLVICSSDKNSGRPTHVGTIKRWSNRRLNLPDTKCFSNISLYILVENMGRLNYGPYIFDKKGILSSVYLDGKILHGWKMYSIPFINLNDVPKKYSGIIGVSAGKKIVNKFVNISKEPAFYSGQFYIDKRKQIGDTYISLSGWSKGVVAINDFTLGRFWPLMGPQCNLYVPAPILKHGENVVVIFESESSNPELIVSLVDQPDFTCGSSKSKVDQL